MADAKDRAARREAFLAGLRRGLSIGDAAASIRADSKSPYRWRRAHPGFARAWDDIVARRPAGGDAPAPPPAPAPAPVTPAPAPVAAPPAAAVAAAADPQARAADAVMRLRHDPLAFVMRAFPWRVPGTPLAGESGPRAWQAEILDEIGAALRRNAAAGVHEAVQHAVASGHGVGKSALVAWVLLWGLSTFPDSRLMIAANTEQQLRTKTWPEIAKWFALLACRDDFKLSDMAITARAPDRARSWRLDRVTWSQYNTEAFQGLHNKGRRIVLAFDEASAIPDSVWEASEGALTDAGTEIVWLVLGNPTRNSGRFRECFGARRARWRTRQIDGRSVPGTNLGQIAAWIEDYGEDSDFVRVRVKGEFPRAAANQFIAGDLVDAAVAREAASWATEPMVLGVDVARHGDDMTVIWARRGRDARSIAPIKLRIPDLMQVAAHVEAQARAVDADAVFVDMGMGAGVVDRLVQMRVPCVYGIEFGARPDGLGSGQPRYANKRAEMWGELRAWLKHGAIPDDPQLKDDLTGPEYAFNVRDEIQLERKEDMKRRGLASPDLGDALALTFAATVGPRDADGRRPGHVTDHDD